MTIFKGTIPVKNFFYMFYYALQDSGTIELPNLPGNVSTEEFHDLRDLFAALLGENLSKQLKQGLYREYIDRTEDLPTIRGKIDITGTIRNKIARRRLLTCEFDELSENTLSNRILKTTAMLLLRDRDVREERKKTLRNEMRYFSNVDEILNPTTIRWSQVRYHRNNQGYRLLIFICRVVLQALLLTTEDGRHVLRTFPSEADEKRFMADIYERFIRGYYQKKFSRDGVNVGIRRINWAVVDYKNKDSAVRIQPIMKTDISLSYPKKKPAKVLIIDAKFYEDILLGKKKKKDDRIDEENGITDDDDKVDRLRSGHLYQIFAYVKNEFDKRNMGKAQDEKKTEVSGMLMYAGTYNNNGSIDVGYKIGENWIYVKALDLNQEFSNIEAQLDGIANDFLFNPPALPLTSKAN